MPQADDASQISTVVQHGGRRRRRRDDGVPCLTVLWHPDPSRVGEEAGLPGLRSAAGERLSRLEPGFAMPGGDATPRRLADPHLSRQPLCLTGLPDGGVRLDPSGTRLQVTVDGVDLRAPHDVGRARLEAGVVLLLGRRVALLLHVSPSPRPRPPVFAGLLGESAAMLRLRDEIRGLADLDHPVLLRGESGTGKELVARALHDAGARRGKLVSVNVSAIPATLAAAELFGAEKGAYSGAEQKRHGHFQQARNGTLFLDEIGDTPADVQVLLLRALEDRRVRPVGASEDVEVDVRVVSATDADLAAAIDAGELSAALYHRLSTCELELPPLRARRDDFGRLFLHFLRQELDAVGELRRLDVRDPGDASWVPAELVADLAGYAWPGNVRELRNVVRQLVVAGRGLSELRVPARVERLLRAKAPPPAARHRHPREVGEAELRQALRDHGWNVRRAADELNVSSSSFYSLMKKYRVRKASDLSRGEIAAAVRRCGGRLDAMAEHLDVSEHGLKLQMHKLGLGPDS